MELISKPSKVVITCKVISQSGDRLSPPPRTFDWVWRSWRLSLNSPNFSWNWGKMWSDAQLGRFKTCQNARGIIHTQRLYRGWWTLFFLSCMYCKYGGAAKHVETHMQVGPYPRESQYHSPMITWACWMITEAHAFTWKPTLCGRGRAKAWRGAAGGVGT